MKWTITKQWSPAQIKLLRYAFDFAIMELGITEAISSINVRLAGRNNDYGMCKTKNDGVEIVIFYKDSMELVISTLFHELTHAKQFILGILSYNEAGHLVWKSSDCTSDNTKYENQPWELEAMEVEEKLTNAFFSC